jgi:hypothetical protein
VLAIKLIIDRAIDKVFARIDAREAARIEEEVRAENANIRSVRRQEELDAPALSIGTGAPSRCGPKEN